LADVIVIGLRGLAFAAALQAAGIPIFIRLFGEDLDSAAPHLLSSALITAGAGILLTLAHSAIEPARLTGDFSGIFDGSLHAILLSSDAGNASMIRLLGLAVLLGSALGRGPAGNVTGLIGASLVAASFAFMGHTATDAQRWLLAPLLWLHLTCIAFWYGSLWPLLLTTRLETPVTGGAVIARFSRIASVFVPVILVAGVLIAFGLLPGLSSLDSAYGMLLLAKILGFSVLMALAAANRWRFGPRIASGDPAAAKAFRFTVITEWGLILTIVMTTAAMTALYSPGH